MLNRTLPPARFHPVSYVLAVTRLARGGLRLEVHKVQRPAGCGNEDSRGGATVCRVDGCAAPSDGKRAWEDTMIVRDAHPKHTMRGK